MRNRGLTARPRSSHSIAPLGDDYASLQENGAQLIDQGGALSHQPVAGAMQRLHVELLFAF
jgi:hypothetical protein